MPAVLWLEKAESILSKLDLKTSDEISKLTQSQVNLSKLSLISYIQTKDHNKYLSAKQYAEKALAIAKVSFYPGDIHYTKIAGAHWQLANVLLVGQNLENALEHVELALEILCSSYTEDDGDSAYGMSRKAAILYAMERYQEAKPIVQKSAIIYEKFFGLTTPICVAIYSLLGDCCIALEEHDEAQTAYEKALNIAEKLYAPGAQQIVEIQEKIKQKIKQK